MKAITIFFLNSFISLTILSGCGGAPDTRNEGSSGVTATEPMADSAKMEIPVPSSKMNDIGERTPGIHENMDMKSFSISSKLIPGKEILGLPASFMDRDFLANGIGYYDNLTALVGMVVKKKAPEPDGAIKYILVRDYKTDSSKIVSRVPVGGTLLEKHYDRKVGAAINHLVGGVQVQSDEAYLLLIQDVSVVNITRDEDINVEGLFKTYNQDPEIDSYYLVRAATTTSVLSRRYTKIKTNTEINAGAIKVNGNLFSEGSELRNDWKIAMQLTPVKEFLKGYTPVVIPTGQ